MTNVRQIAALTLTRLARDQETLAQLLPNASKQVADVDRALLQDLCFGTCRWYPRIKQVYLQMMDKPFKEKDTDLEMLMYIGIYQLGYSEIAEHAAISETVDAVKKLQKHWAVKLINALLRRYQREKDALNQQAIDFNEQGLYAHPNWLIKAVTKFWPNEAEEVFAANNAHPPFVIRVNAQQNTRDHYLSLLSDAGIGATACEFSDVGIRLDQPTAVQNLPGFEQAACSVQDEAAQFAATLLDLQPGQTLLDACAAPGGKTLHILEAEPELARLACLDISNKRLRRVEENLVRAGVEFQYDTVLVHQDAEDSSKSVSLVAGDALVTEQWCDESVLFDRILLDAPCSATGVIRRHPDIKLLRLANQIETLANLQLEILRSLWTKLKPGGRLVYATCSIFPEENTENIARFLTEQTDAVEIKIDAPWGIEQIHGKQLLAKTNGHDGFYYCVLEKAQC